MIKHWLTGVVVGWVLTVVAGFVVVWAGMPNVATGWQDPPPLRWLLHTTYERSVARRAADVVVPAAADDLDQALTGARAFDEMCSVCHTPPGLSATVHSQGLNPPPPELSQLLTRRTPAQAFWVIRSGVRMTGMPAFGPTHQDAQLWQLVAFLKRAQGMDAAGYKEIMAAARQMPAGDGHDHRHGNGSAHDEEAADAAMPADESSHADQGGAAQPADQAVPSAPAGGHSHDTDDRHEH